MDSNIILRFERYNKGLPTNCSRYVVSELLVANRNDEDYEVDRSLPYVVPETESFRWFLLLYTGCELYVNDLRIKNGL